MCIRDSSKIVDGRRAVKPGAADRMKQISVEIFPGPRTIMAPVTVRTSLFRNLALAAVLISAVGCVRYQARPIVPGRVLDDLEARRLDSPELGRFLIANKEIEAWPPAAWDLKSLTLAALYYHPDMDIARAQWGVARGGRITAGERPNPTLSPSIGYNTTCLLY